MLSEKGCLAFEFAFNTSFFVKRTILIIAKIKSKILPFIYWFTKHPDRFLKDISGVVHVGANSGQETKLYNDFSLRVIWVEPITEVFTELKEKIKNFNNQQCFQALVTDIDGKEYQFHISNNKGKSSSILDLKYHKDIWPDVSFNKTISLKSITLTSLLLREQVDPCEYKALIIDTQGSELLVLKGSVPILENFIYIKTEVADFESYEGCCQVDDIYAFMSKHGYKEFSRKKIISRQEVGNYFDIVYRKIA
jgi:FkbM family methyltransferase